jgi:major membrane immunogen (membrane-anchored lipoprotein)
MKKFGFTAMMVALLLMCSCGGKNGGGSKENDADIEAATIAGREEARIFVNTVWQDSMELQQRLLTARAKSSKYEMAGQPRAKEAFDSAFVSTIRTVRPEVAAQLKP